MHDAVVKRDRFCFMRRIEPDHVCRDRWGRPHLPSDQTKLTVDHVHHVEGGVRGKRAPSDLRHLVAMCAKANIDGPSRTVRQAEREYLSGLYGPIAMPSW